MPWLFLLLAVAAFAIAFMASSMAVVVVCLLAAMVLLVLWCWACCRNASTSRSRDDAQMLDPRELQHAELAEARRAGAEQPQAAAPGDPPRARRAWRCLDPGAREHAG